jgi:hypothetical protein
MDQILPIAPNVAIHLATGPHTTPSTGPNSNFTERRHPSGHRPSYHSLIWTKFQFHRTSRSTWPPALIPYPQLDQIPIAPNVAIHLTLIPYPHLDLIPISPNVAINLATGPHTIPSTGPNSNFTERRGPPGHRPSYHTLIWTKFQLHRTSRSTWPPTLIPHPQLDQITIASNVAIHRATGPHNIPSSGPNSNCTERRGPPGHRPSYHTLIWTKFQLNRKSRSSR